VQVLFVLEGIGFGFELVELLVFAGKKIFIFIFRKEIIK